MDFGFADLLINSRHQSTVLKHCASCLTQALLSMPKLRKLHCDWLGLAAWQYVDYNNRYRGSIQMIAQLTKCRLLENHHTCFGYSEREVWDLTQRGREELFFAI